MARFSSKMLKDLEQSYRSRIVRERDDEDRKFRIQKSDIKELKQADMIAAIHSAILNSGADSATITSCDLYNSDFSIHIRVKHDLLSTKTPEIVEIDNNRRESCKRHKQMLQDLDDWVISCIEKQEITPFANVPDIEHSSIECF